MAILSAMAAVQSATRALMASGQYMSHSLILSVTYGSYAYFPYQSMSISCSWVQGLYF